MYVCNILGTLRCAFGFLPQRESPPDVVINGHVDLAAMLFAGEEDGRGTKQDIFVFV